MADVRALLAAERQSRRISHPHLSYTKSGMLMCNVCSLNVKSETLWEGHLRSPNHRKNVAAQSSRQASVDAGVSKGVKRKIEDVDEEVEEERVEADTDPRKKPKSRPESALLEGDNEAHAGPVLVQVDKESAAPEPESVPPPVSTKEEPTPAVGTSTADAAIDEDEWAAFEREVAPLAAEKPDYTSATITAAPVTADQVKAQEDEDKRRRLDTEADDEREDELGKIAEEFDVMEEMEERVRKMREKRDALRNGAKVEDDTGQASASPAGLTLANEPAILNATGLREEEDDEDNEDDEEADDWYS